MKEVLEMIGKYIMSSMDTIKISDLKRNVKYSDIEEPYDNLTIKEFLILYKIERLYNSKNIKPSSYDEYMDNSKRLALMEMFISYCKLNERIKYEKEKELLSNDTYHSVILKRLEKARNQIEETLKINKIIPLNIEFNEAINALLDTEIKQNAKIK